MVVVGGGPAGAVAAMLLARDGWDVELIERREFPRAKPCGECISPGANPLLQRLGLWDSVVRAQPARLLGWRLTFENDSSFSSLFAAATNNEALHTGIAIGRDRFDAALLSAARAAGVTVRTGVQCGDLAYSSNGSVAGIHTRAAGRSTRLDARLTLGADGLRSRVARQLSAYRRAPRLRKFSLTAHVRGVQTAHELGELHLDSAACLGIAPIDSSSSPVFNITAVARAGLAAGGAGSHDLLRRVLRRFRGRELSQLITDDSVILASGPFDWPARRIIFDGAALVGDAAGYFDPFTGQGIFQAIAGAELLAEHAAAALRNRNVTARSLSAYAAAHRRLLRPARRIQQAIEYVCARPRLARALFARLHETHEAADRLIAVTADARPARDLLSPLLMARLIAATSTRADA